MKYQDISDEELSQILIYANEEHRRRQNERYEKLTQKQLDETATIKEKSMNMYMDYSETEKPLIDKVNQFKDFVSNTKKSEQQDQKDMEECQQKSSEEFVKEMERDGAFPSSYAERSYSERGEIVVEDTMKRHSFKKDE
jgi:hypothetical protein